MSKCPICGAPANLKARPFCSSRCADVDLGRWFQGKYGIPAVDAADDAIVEAMLADNKSKIQDDGNRQIGCYDFSLANNDFQMN